MKTKLFFGLLLVLGTLALSSCTKDASVQDIDNIGVEQSTRIGGVGGSGGR